MKSLSPMGTIAESKDILRWIEDQGVRWQPSLGGTLSLGRTNSFFLGGGRAMLNALYRTAERLGVNRILTVDERDFRAVRAAGGKPFQLLPADA